MIPRWLRSRLQANHRNIKPSRQHRRSGGKRGPSRRPFLEPLEDRTLLSVTFTPYFASPVVPVINTDIPLPDGTATARTSLGGSPVEPQISNVPAARQPSGNPTTARHPDFPDR